MTSIPLPVVLQLSFVSRQVLNDLQKRIQASVLCVIFFCLLFAFATPAHPQGTGDWAWMNGSSSPGIYDGQLGVYGTLGTFAAGNAPPSRWGASTWTDSSGNFWLFGGYGIDADGAQSGLNDLWEFNPSSNEWAWMGGSIESGTTSGLPGVYGTLGTFAAGNTPGTRYGAVSWTDHSGNLWLFGGLGFDGVGGAGWLNDLWEFNPSTKEWAWISGSDTASQPGVYGTLGTAAAGNVPGGRTGASSWIDKSGNLWLFGGEGYASSGQLGWLNDLWEFNPTKSEWTWISGSSTMTCPGSNGADCGQPGVYGTLGTAAAGNVPGSREWSTSWIDSNGNLWLFAGGFNTPGPDDLWKFNPATTEWTWMGGSSASDQSGVYGTLGTPAAGNIPGSRIQASGWTDSSGNFWLYGGEGYSATGVFGYLGDLWKFSPATNEWTWINGSSASGPSADYGILGTSAANNSPGAREGASNWLDSGGNLWLFGGNSSPNDLWKYQLSTATLPAAAPPTLSLTSGTYTTVETLTMSDSTAGATIYYSANATSATPVWTAYGGPITVGTTETIEAIAMANGYSTSAAATAAYTINLPATATPTFSVPGGTYTTTQTVILSDATAGATIYYTINGTTPTTSSPVYTGAITVSSSETIEAIALAPGHSSSAVSSATYTITASPTLISLVSSANPSNVSQYVTFTATVTGPAGVEVPTGSVQFSVNGMAANLPVSQSGTASYTTAALFAGTNIVTATYIPTSGSTFAGSTTSLAQSVAGDCAGITATTLTSSLNPSIAGQSVTFTATVMATAIPACVIGTPGTGAATYAPSGIYGTVQFTVNGVAAGLPVTVSSGSANVFTGVAATFTTSALSAGTNVIGAVFTEGNGFFESSTATGLSQTVTAPTFTVSVSPASLTIAQGGKGNSLLTVTGGFAGEFPEGITFAASNLPNGVLASFSPTSTTGSSVLTLSVGSTVAAGTYTVTVSAIGNLSSTLEVLLGSTTIVLTVTPPPPTSCTIFYQLEPQNNSQFGVTITIDNTGTTALTGWTLNWSFANGQTIEQLWDGVETQNGANVTVTNESYNGSIPAGTSYTGVGFNATWNGVTNAIPTAFSLNGVPCTVN